MFKIEKDLGDIGWHRTLWYKDAELTILHREDGPAIEFADGDKCWYLNGKRHRIDGPAFEYTDGSKYWYLNDKSHRIDGPAVEYADGTKDWWLNDQFMEFQDWKQEVRKYYDNQEDYLLMLLKLD